MQKSSSNVIEKCFEFVGDSVVSIFINEVGLNEKIIDLMINNYGNYVVQKALLKTSRIEDKKNLVNNILANIDKIQDKKINSKWRSIIESHETEFDSDIFLKRESSKTISFKEGINQNNNKSVIFHQAQHQNYFDYNFRITFFYFSKSKSK